MSTSPSDASIPVLTQVIGSTTSTATNVNAQPAAAKPQVAPPSQSAASAVPQNTSLKTDEEWRALEKKLNERVLVQIMRRSDFVIEHRLKEGLTEIVEKATQEMIKEIRAGLQTTLEDIVMRAVAQEMARLQAIKE